MKAAVVLSVSGRQAEVSCNARDYGKVNERRMKYDGRINEERITKYSDKNGFYSAGKNVFHKTDVDISRLWGWKRFSQVPNAHLQKLEETKAAGS